jgi:hypothetical protein
MTSRRSSASAGCTVLLLCGLAALGAGADDSKGGARRPEAVVRRMTDYYRQVKSFTVDVNLEQKPGVATFKTTVAVAVKVPNKLAIHTRGFLLAGTDIFSDGKTLTISVGPAKKYYQSKAPASFPEISVDEPAQEMVISTLFGTMILEIMDAGPFQPLMERVKTAEYVGEEVLDGAKVQHVKCTQQDAFDWEVWIAAEGDPVIRKVVMDTTKSAANSPNGAQLKGQKLGTVATFKGWKIDAPMDDRTFVFEPPAGSQRVDSLKEIFEVDGGGGGRGREKAPALLGKLGPDINRHDPGIEAAVAKELDAPLAGRAEAVLQQTVDYYKKVKSFAVEVEREQQFGPRAMKNTVAVVMERPNKLAVHTKMGTPAVDIVCDGKTLTASIAATKKYAQHKAPAALYSMGTDPDNHGVFMAVIQPSLLFQLMHDDAYGRLMGPVKTSAYVGEEVLDGAKARHVKFIQDDFDWEIWVAAEGNPLLRKVATDMRKSVSKFPPLRKLEGQKFEVVQTYKGWKVDAPVDEKQFSFEPPPGWHKVERLMEPFGGAGR